jgi:hypothetical protein
MTEQSGGEPPGFVATKAYRRKASMCDGCRRTRVVGLGYGPPGTGKTESAEQYAQWSLFKPFLPEPLITFTGGSAVDGLYPYRPLAFASASLDVPIQECRTVFSTPPVSASAARIEKEVLMVFAAFSYLVEAANQLHQGNEEFLVTRRFSRHIELLIVDEANWLKDAGLEVIRDIADRGKFGLVLLGMPGLDKRLMRAPQLYSRIGFAQKIEPLSDKAGPQPVTSDKYTFSGDVQISLKRFEESGVARVECPGCGRTWTLSPSGGVLHFKAHDKHKMNTPNTGRRWVRGEGETDWNMVGGESK